MLLDLPGPLDVKVTQCCNEFVITWSTVCAHQTCPITGYNIYLAIGNNTVIVPGNQTTYTQPISDSLCGSTIQISMSVSNAAETGIVTTMSHNAVCTRECRATKICFFVSPVYTIDLTKIGTIDIKTYGRCSSRINMDRCPLGVGGVLQKKQIRKSILPSLHVCLFGKVAMLVFGSFAISSLKETWIRSCYTSSISSHAHVSCINVKLSKE